MTQTMQRARKGFTLTEAAIVLGIMGLILGAIWVAAASVYANMRVNKVETQILQVAQAVRSLYATSATTGEADGDITSGLISAGAFPNDVISGNLTVTPWGSAAGVNAFKVYSSTISATGDAFKIAILNVPQSACISLAKRISASSDTGFFGVGKNDNATEENLTVTTLANITTNVCSAATGTVTFSFRVRG